MTTHEQELEMEISRKFARAILATLLSLAGLFLVAGAVVSMLAH